MFCNSVNVLLIVQYLFYSSDLERTVNRAIEIANQMDNVSIVACRDPLQVNCNYINVKFINHVVPKSVQLTVDSAIHIHVYTCRSLSMYIHIL